MCGRYYIDTESDLIEIRKIFAELNDRYIGHLASGQLHGGEIFPTQVAPVIRPITTPSGIKLLPDLMQWGFTGQSTLINARSETATVKPTFKQTLHEGRVLIPATAFFEWQKPSPLERNKAKMRLYRPDEPVFYMAGLYRPIPASENPYNLPGQFVIVTGAANSSMSSLHDRMPLIIPRQLLRPYLQDEAAAIRLLNQPIDAQLMIEIADKAV
ncbi:MAG: SOS response-associated peptidase family protein [Eubacteriales bacterium]|nr:SOS response-associated peptidase family protein [Eubacteriales bacterium]